MDLIELLVDNIAATDYTRLSDQTVEAVKKIVIDVVGDIIAGTSAEGTDILLDLLRGWGGRGEATVWVFGGKLPAHHAALINCMMARARDLDDVHEQGGGHLGATFVPAAYVLAEYANKAISGKDLILAIASGSDIGCRLRSALKVQWGWVAETFAPLGVIATAGKLLGLSKEQMRNGMGIAYSQCSCNSQGVVDGALTVRLQQGIGAKAGILSALLAEKGYTGSKNVLQGTFGLYPLYGRNEYDPKVITDELGRRFEIAYTSIKPYPSCKHTHIPIDGTMQILKEHSIKASELKQITVLTNTAAYSKCGSGENKYNPETTIDAQFSIPYTVATAAIKRKVFIDDFTAESIKDPETLALAQKVAVRVDPEIDKIPGLIAPNKVEVETEDGKRYSKYVEFVKGHPQNPMTMAECAEKFYNCARFSIKPLNKKNAAEFLRMAENLEQVRDVTQMVQLLVI